MREILPTSWLQHLGKWTSTPHLGNTIELALVAWVRNSLSPGVGSWSHPLPGQSRRAGLGSMGTGELAGWLTNSVNTKAQIQDFKLSHPNIYPIDELLDHMKGSVLQIQSCSISMTQGNSRLSRRSLNIGRWQKQRPWTGLRTHCNEHLQIKLFE